MATRMLFAAAGGERVCVSGGGGVGRQRWAVSHKTDRYTQRFCAPGTVLKPLRT